METIIEARNIKQMTRTLFVAVTKRLRSLSWLTFVLGAAFSVAWGWYQLESFERLNPKSGCGMPVLAILALAVILFGAFSLFAGVLNFLAFRRLLAPRGFKRKFELSVIVLPGALISAALLWGLLTCFFPNR